MPVFFWIGDDQPVAPTLFDEVSKMTTRGVSYIFAALVLAATATITSARAEEPRSTEPIKLAVHDWTGNLITTGIAKAVLERAGYRVSLIQSEYMGMWPGLESGDIDLAIEVWITSAGDLMNASIASGKTINLGTTGLVGLDRWWYPKYVEEECPGLPDYKALNDCVELFSTPLTSPRGRILLFPAAWGGFDDERVEALDLNFDIVRAGSEASLYAEVKAAIDRKEPILAWLYEPHWAPIRFEGSWVDMPEYEEACYNDPSWGVNPDKAYDCGKPSGPIWKVGWSGMKDKWPEAVAVLSALELNNEELGDMIGAIDLDGQKTEDVVAEWMATNTDRWQAWLPK